MDLELMMEKVTSFASEIRHLSNQIADFTKLRNDPRYDANDLKDVLSHLMQQFTASSDEKSKEPATSPSQSVTSFSTSMQTGKALSSPNSFLKLQELMDDANQPIVVSSVKRKEAHAFNFPSSHLYSQKSVPIKRVRMEQPSSHHRHPSPPAEDEGNRLNISVQHDPSNSEKRSDASRLEQKKEPKLFTQADEVSLESIHKAAGPLKNQDERSEEIDQNMKIRGKHEYPVPPDGQEVLMQDQTTASEISANGQKSDSEAHEMETTPSSVSVPIEEDAITQTEDLFIEKEKPSKWGLWSLFKKTKIPQ